MWHLNGIRSPDPTVFQAPGALVSTSIPFWPVPGESYAGALPDRADVVVIGGGIAGVSVLHHLGLRRVNAVLVERSNLAAGASGRNAGFLLAGVAASYAEAVRVYGRSKAREVWSLTNENHDAMIEAVGGDDVGYRRLGSVTLAASDQEASQLEESEAMLREDGFDARWDGLRLINPRDGEANPAAIVGALARRAPRGAIREGVEVTALEASSDGVTVHAGGKVCRAGVVILATNAYTSQLVPQVAIQPTRAQMLASAPVPERVSELPTYSHYGYRYWRQLDRGEVLVGGWRDTSMETEIGYEEQPTAAIQSHLDAQLERLSPSARVSHRWAGIMGFTESGLPLVGPLEGMPNVHLCAGFNGHGMGFAFMSARRVAEAL
jgi:gamma-glutamylputrescine oxidase